MAAGLRERAQTLSDAQVSVVIAIVFNNQLAPFVDADALGMFDGRHQAAWVTTDSITEEGVHAPPPATRAHVATCFQFSSSPNATSWARFEAAFLGLAPPTAPTAFDATAAAANICFTRVQGCRGHMMPSPRSPSPSPTPACPTPPTAPLCTVRSRGRAPWRSTAPRTRALRCQRRSRRRGHSFVLSNWRWRRMRTAEAVERRRRRRRAARCPSGWTNASGLRRPRRSS